MKNGDGCERKPSTGEGSPKLDLLEEIPSPVEPSRKADPFTRDELNARQQFSLEIKMILIAVGSFGVMCLFLAVALNNATARHGADNQISRVDRNADAEIDFIHDVALSIGTELLASALLLFFLYYVLKEHKRPLACFLFLAGCGLFLCSAPVLFWQSYWGGLLAGFGIEVLGWLLIYAVLENVINVFENQGPAES